MGGICSRHPNVLEQFDKSPKDGKELNKGKNKKPDSTENGGNRKHSGEVGLNKTSIGKTESNLGSHLIDSLKNYKPDSFKLNGANLNGEINPNDYVYNPNKCEREYIKGECVGEGKIGRVYSALNTNTGEIVAIKSIKLDKSQSLQKQIFDVNEAVEKLAKLQHKNIIKYMCTQLSDNEDEVDIVYEFCNGGSVKQLLEKFGSFEEKLIKLYVKQILEGLVYLHDLGIVHRNINNSNVLVDGNGTVKLSDFVVSNILIGEHSESLLYFNTKGGTQPPYWMAPEIVNKEANLTPAVDIWSIGCIVIEMATTQPPWSNLSKDCNAVIELISKSHAPPKFPSHLSKDCKSFLNQCLQINPKDRLSAKKLLEHKFFKVENEEILNKVSTGRTPHKSKKSLERKSLKRLSSKSSEKSNERKDSISRQPKRKNSKKERLGSDIIKKKSKFHIIENKDEKLNKQKSIVNLLANDTNNGAYFSVSMTVNSQPSIVPQGFEFKVPNGIIEEINNSHMQQGGGSKKTLLDITNEQVNNSEFFLKKMIDDDMKNIHTITSHDHPGTLNFKNEEFNNVDSFVPQRDDNVPGTICSLGNFISQINGMNLR